MGMFDYYEDVQLKIGAERFMRGFRVGDKVPIDDGVYVGYEGVVVVKNGKFVAKFDTLMSKWGGEVDFHTMVENLNPVTKAVKEAVKTVKKERKRK